MIKFLVLLLVALIVFPVVIIFLKKIDIKSKLMFLIGGLLIALLGILVQSSLSLYYALLIMIGLVFAGAVLITKQIEKQKLAAEELSYQEPQTIKEAVGNPTKTDNVVETYTPGTPEPIHTPNAGADWFSPKKKEEQ